MPITVNHSPGPRAIATPAALSGAIKRRRYDQEREDRIKQEEARMAQQLAMQQADMEFREAERQKDRDQQIILQDDRFDKQGELEKTRHSEAYKQEQEKIRQEGLKLDKAYQDGLLTEKEYKQAQKVLAMKQAGIQNSPWLDDVNEPTKEEDFEQSTHTDKDGNVWKKDPRGGWDMVYNKGEDERKKAEVIRKKREILQQKRISARTKMAQKMVDIDANPPTDEEGNTDKERVKILKDAEYDKYQAEVRALEELGEMYGDSPRGDGALNSSAIGYEGYSPNPNELSGRPEPEDPFNDGTIFKDDPMPSATPAPTSPTLGGGGYVPASWGELSRPPRSKSEALENPTNGPEWWSKAVVRDHSKNKGSLDEIYEFAYSEKPKSLKQLLAIMDKMNKSGKLTMKEAKDVRDALLSSGKLMEMGAVDSLKLKQDSNYFKELAPVDSPDFYHVQF